MQDSFGRFLQQDIEYDDGQAEQADYKNYIYTRGDQWLITEETKRIRQPAGMPIELMPYQLASIWVMFKMESSKQIKSGKNVVHYTHCGILSNKLGSGKTATIIGLITHSRMPANGPCYPVCIPIRDSDKRNTSKRSISVLFRNFKLVLRPSLIFVGISVLHQWEEEIKKFSPGLKYFVVSEIRSLKQFYKLLYSPLIQEYDIILLKNKTITGNWEWEHGEVEEDCVDKTTKSIYNTVGVMCRNVCFSRLIIDDFDTIGVPTQAVAINSLFIWLISSTRKKINHAYTNFKYYDIEDLSHMSYYAFCDVNKNHILYDLFNIHVCEKFYDVVKNVGAPIYNIYRFENRNLKMMTYIQGFAFKNANEIMEALNGDAIGEAAEIAGIEANSVGGIFKTLFNKNFERITQAKKILGLFTSYFDSIDIDSLPPFSENPDQTDTYNLKHLRSCRPIEWRYPGIRSLLRDEKENWTAVLKECQGALDKFKYSVKKNECQVCNLELDDPDENYAVLPCCSEIIHADCAVRGCAFKRSGGSISGWCPFNKSHKVNLEDICYIKTGFDLSSVDLNNIEEGVETPQVVEETESFDNGTKYEAIAKLALGQDLRDPEPAEVILPQLLKGPSLGLPAYKTKLLYFKDAMSGKFSHRVQSHLVDWLVPLWKPKLLVFGNFDESLNKVATEFNKSNSRYERLGGSADHINQQVQRFNTGATDHLLIKSTVNCASLNLQIATDLVFSHHIIEENIRAQVIGRIQRSGRTSDARVHFMLYEGE